MKFVFDFAHTSQLTFPEVIERPIGHGFEVGGVPAGAGIGGATGAHARVVS